MCGQDQEFVIVSLEGAENLELTCAATHLPLLTLLLTGPKSKS